MKTDLRQELQEINRILEDHLHMRIMDCAFGYEPPLLEEEQEYLDELCRRKMEIGYLLRTNQEEEYD